MILGCDGAAWDETTKALMTQSQATRRFMPRSMVEMPHAAKLPLSSRG
jgi:hypothetical protein